jgi:hypothetical protein
MPNRLSIIAVLAALPTIALAQGPAPNAAICDGSDMRHAAQMRTVGRSIFGATALADLAAVLTIPRTPDGAKQAGSHFRVVAITAPVALTGLFIAGRASPGEGFWENVVAHLKVGETKSTDVRSCLQRPQVRTSNGREERWTYLTVRPSVFDASHLHSLQLTFRDSVLAEVLTREVDHSAISATHLDSAGPRLDRHRGFCAPPIPVVGDAFPTPTDTSAAAAAMARAKADADAAMKNAAAAAAYAACMASDSVR